MLELVKRFKYGSCMIFCSTIHLNCIFAILVSFGRCFFKRCCHVWILRLVSPLRGDIVYLDISSMTTSILSIFHSLHTPSDNLFLWSISESALFTVSYLWIVYCFYIGVLHVASAVFFSLCQFLKVLVPFRLIFLVFQEIAWEIFIDNFLYYTICSLLI